MPWGIPVRKSSIWLRRQARALFGHCLIRKRRGQEMPACIGGFFLHPERGDGETNHLGKKGKEGGDPMLIKRIMRIGEESLVFHVLLAVCLRLHHIQRPGVDIQVLLGKNPFPDLILQLAPVVLSPRARERIGLGRCWASALPISVSTPKRYWRPTDKNLRFRDSGGGKRYPLLDQRGPETSRKFENKTFQWPQEARLSLIG